MIGQETKCCGMCSRMTSAFEQRRAKKHVRASPMIKPHGKLPQLSP